MLRARLLSGIKCCSLAPRKTFIDSIGQYASVLEANASRYHGKAAEELDWSEKQRQTRAVAEYLAVPSTRRPSPIPIVRYQR